MDDFISREDTIEKMEEVDWYHQNKNGEMVHGANPAEHQAWYKVEDVYKVLEDMPSAQLECEKSEWIEEDYVTKIKIRCKKCGEYARGVYRSKFCPNCGRNMWGKNNGKTT